MFGNEEKERVREWQQQAGGPAVEEERVGLRAGRYDQSGPDAHSIGLEPIKD
jgi:hypothetical protein